MTKIPERVGEYRLMRHIRSGANTEIYHAVNLSSQDKRVLKVLSPKALANREKIQQLRHEFQVAGRLNHRNVLKVYEFCKPEPYAFIVLEPFPGNSLRQMLLEKRRDEILEHLPQLVEQMSGALWHLHQHGWAHGSVKPSNFLINPEFDLKLIDFALAKRIKKSKLQFWTRKHLPVGSPSYMAPEQIRGQAVDHRSDIYSLGCTLFELIEGHVPYTGASQNELLNKHLSSKIPRLSSNSQHVTSPLADLIAAMMGKRPEDRPQSMYSILSSLRDIFQVAEPVALLPAATNTSMGHTWQSKPSGQLAAQEGAIRTSSSTRASEKANRAKPSTIEHWGRNVGRIFRRRSVQVACGVVVVSMLAWQVLKPEDDRVYQMKLERYQQIAASIARPPELSSPEDRDAYWTQLRSDAQQASEDANDEQVRSSSPQPAQMELRWAAELLPAAVQEARSSGDLGRSQSSLTVHLNNAQRFLEERAVARTKDPLGLYSFLDSNLFFWGLLAVDVLGVAWVVKLFFTRRN